MINTEVEISGSFFEKSILVAQMIALLNKLEDNDILMPNRVGNISVIRDGDFIGFIDVSFEELDLI